MRIELHIVVMADDGTEQHYPITALQRESLSPETLGLTLAESKQILQQTQQIMVDHHVATYLAAACRHAGDVQSHRGGGAHLLRRRRPVVGT